MNDAPSPSCEHVRINGQKQAWKPDWSVADLLREMGADGPAVAVERNSEVVPRREHAQVWIEAGDRLEVVSLVGGG